jgi:hypothetical protein
MNLLEQIKKNLGVHLGRKQRDLRKEAAEAGHILPTPIRAHHVMRLST